MYRHVCVVLILLGFLLCSTGAGAAEEGPDGLEYGDKGWVFTSADAMYRMAFQSRLQFRYVYPMDADPLSCADFPASELSTFKIRRARLKIGGHAFEKWLKYYWEYELASASLLDFRVMVTKYPGLSLKAGQWKAQYNRERIISSGKQQMVERSLITRPFTIDRQQGVSIFGHLKPGDKAGFSYWLSVFTGMGRGGGANDDAHMMYMARAQWNFMGRELKFSSSDVTYHEEVAGVLAFGAVTNRSPYTRFSQDGGGDLPGFEEGPAGQYRVNQWMGETALMYRGFSWQQEFHWKEIHDLKDCTVTKMIGNYAQLGYFFHHVWEAVPEPLELAFRHAFYRPDTDISDNLQQEFSLDLNWFFKGHLNKLTGEVSYLRFAGCPTGGRDKYRFRLQWDISV